MWHRVLWCEISLPEVVPYIVICLLVLAVYGVVAVAYRIVGIRIGVRAWTINVSAISSTGA